MKRTIRVSAVIRISSDGERWCQDFCAFRSHDRCRLFLARDESLRSLRLAADGVHRFRCKPCMQAVEVTP